MTAFHRERHRTGHVGWLRAAVLGTNDGILSTASLVRGVAAAHGTRGSVFVAGIAGLVAGAMSMAAGEYVSVHSQADTEEADLGGESAEITADDEGEHRELAAIYISRGLDPCLAKQVAEQLMAHDAIGAHARDELGMSEKLMARPIQAALASASSFAVGAAMPLIVTALAPFRTLLETLKAAQQGCGSGRLLIRTVSWSRAAIWAAAESTGCAECLLWGKTTRLGRELASCAAPIPALAALR
jgi:vacuolar iron transporter family protein